MDDGFSELARRHQRQIYTFSFYFLGESQDAEDVTQEVLIRLWRHRHGVDPERLTAWTMSVTRNCCVDVLRKRKRRNAVVSPTEFDTAASWAADDGPDPGAQTVNSELRRSIESAISRLDEPYRSVVVMREIQELSYGEICEALEAPLNTVKSHLHRGRKMLRERLRKELVHEAI